MLISAVHPHIVNRVVLNSPNIDASFPDMNLAFHYHRNFVLPSYWIFDSKLTFLHLQYLSTTFFFLFKSIFQLNSKRKNQVAVYTRMMTNERVTVKSFFQIKLFYLPKKVFEHDNAVENIVLSK